jgi:putative ABC transport system permease protein
MNLITVIYNLSAFASKNSIRNRLRSFFTLIGVMSGMFLFTSIETIQTCLHDATVSNASDNTLVVYRENRFCPSTSRLPEYYKNEIATIDGVKSVHPIQIVVNNCGTSLDVVVFRGIHRDYINNQTPKLHLLNGSFDEWAKRIDGALIGENLAKRRNLSVGDKFDAAGITVEVSAIVETDDSGQNNNVAFVHLDFLQQASKIGLGIVTQFNVKVTDPSEIDNVALAIDERFSSDTEPTSTQPEKAFFANTALELIKLIRFTRWIGIACVFAVIGLVANSILLSVRGRISEYAVLKTLGYSKLSIAWIILSESILLSFVGGGIGILLSFIFLDFQRISIGSEGLILAFIPTLQVMVIALILAIFLGVISGLYPAWEGSKRPIATNLKSF